MAITVGSVANFSSGQATHHCSAMLDTNKVVLVYHDVNDSSKTKIVVGTISGTTVSWGTAAIINSGYFLNSNKTGIAVLSSGLVVVCFNDNSSTTSQVVACTISGTTVTVGTPISIGNSCVNPRISALSSTSFVLAYRNGITTYGGTVVGTVSTRTITLGDFVSCGYDFEGQLYHTIIGLDSTHFVLSYQANDYLDKNNYTVLGTISSGTTHSLGGRAAIKNYRFNGTIRVAKLSSTKFVYVYRDNKAVVCSYSGTTITVGSEQSLSNDIYTSSYAFDVDALSDTLIIIGGYDGSSFKKFIAYTVGGTTLTKEGAAVNINSGRPYAEERFYLSSLTSTKFSATWVIQSSYGQIVVADYAPPVVAPTVTTQAATNIAQTSCTGNGNITATGGANATRRGFCYKVGTSGDPTISDSVAYDDGSFGTGAFTKSITGLSAETNYRVRAYAVNSAGTSYGTTVDVKTSSAFIPRTTIF